MPTYHPDENGNWWPEWEPPPDWRDDELWLIAAIAIAVFVGLIVIIVADGGGL